MDVKLETIKLIDGITIFEADTFEAEKEVFIVTEDEQKIPVPVGDYELEDGRLLVVTEEGLIAEIKEAKDEEEVVEEEAKSEEEGGYKDDEKEEKEEIKAKKTIESVVKETFFSELEKLQQENIELKSKLEELTKVDAVATEATELNEVKPITYNPENTNEVEHFQYASKRPRSIMDSIIEKINK